MVNYHAQFRQLLMNAAQGVAVYYEAISEKVATPCISYMEASNNSSAIGDTLSYSEIVFQVKVWAETVDELLTITQNIDSALQGNGFIRTNSYETTDDGLLVKILRYTATGYETNRR